MEGWIKLYRKLQECWLWKSKEPFDRRSAWVDLLLLAVHNDSKMLIDSNVVSIGRGSFLTSVLKLSERWMWSRGKTNRFLKLLESEQMITTKRTHSGTLITIVNYRNYQAQKYADDTTVGTTIDTTDSTTVDTTDDTTVGTMVGTQNKNVKNDKNIKRNEIFVDTNVSTHISQRENPPESEGSHFSYVEIVEEYNAICKDLPKVKLLTDARKQQLRVCSNLLKEAGVDFKGYFAKVQQSDFLTGRNDGKRKWRADFDWICKKGNCTKILEGVYDNRKDTNKWCEY